MPITSNNVALGSFALSPLLSRLREPRNVEQLPEPNLFPQPTAPECGQAQIKSAQSHSGSTRFHTGWDEYYALMATMTFSPTAALASRCVIRQQSVWVPAKSPKHRGSVVGGLVESCSMLVSSAISC
jgi:hypothetical protein